MSTTRLELIPLTELLRMRFRKNPKRHAIEDLIESFMEHGFKNTPLIDDQTETMVAGHGRCKALERMKFDGADPPDGIELGDRGEWLVPTQRTTFKSERSRDAYVVADNRIGEKGGYDSQALANLLEELAQSDEGLTGTGFSDGDLEDLLGELAGDADPDDRDVEPAEEDENVVDVEGHTRVIGGHKVRPPAQMTNADWTIHLGDCLEGLRKLPDNSADSIVTDPPAGISFMGRAWDEDKGGRDRWVDWLRAIMVECLRVLKPGGHILSWALPRTSHWTMTAIENARFEIRDVVYHAFGTGFPKSLDVSKAIDQKLGVSDARPVIGTRTDGVGNTDASMHKHEGFAASRETTFDVTGPSSAAAAAWLGWGTALKPAVEPWIMARKPLEGTVAENILRWSVGAVNVDATRVGAVNVDATRVGVDMMAVTKSDGTIVSDNYSMAAPNTGRVNLEPKQGRWPSHLVLSHSDACIPIGRVEDTHSINVGERIGDGSRSLKFGMGKMETTTTTTTQMRYQCVLGCPVRMLDEQGGRELGDGLGVSRFFYVAKPSKAETEAGLDTLPIKSGTEVAGRGEDSAGMNSPRAGVAKGSRRNTHPTKKSIALMRYLVRLITPRGGTVVDPFTGSGATGMAALVEGCKFIGFEKEPEFHAIASERMRSIIEDPRLADEIEVEESQDDGELGPESEPEVEPLVGTGSMVTSSNGDQVYVDEPEPFEGDLT